MTEARSTLLIVAQKELIIQSNPINLPTKQIWPEGQAKPTFTKPML